MAAACAPPRPEIDKNNFPFVTLHIHPVVIGCGHDRMGHRLVHVVDVAGIFAGSFGEPGKIGTKMTNREGSAKDRDAEEYKSLFHGNSGSGSARRVNGIETFIPESRLVQHRASGESKLPRVSKRFGMTGEASAGVPGRFKKETELEGESDKTW